MDPSLDSIFSSLETYPVALMLGIVSVLCLAVLFLYFAKEEYRNSLFTVMVFIAIILWPASQLLISLHNLNRSKTVEFCGSCHEMSLHVKDALNPKSKSLAAKHTTRFWINKNPCYECHTNYTMFGPIEAKFSGMKHMYVSVFGNKAEKDIKIYAPYPDKNCMKCHDTLRVKNEEDHEDIDPDERCVDCHDKLHKLSKKKKSKEAK